MYSHENHAVIAQYNLKDAGEIVASQSSVINASKSLVGNLPIQIHNLDLSLYYIKYILPTNDIVIVLTLFSSEIPKSFPINVLESLLKDYKEYRETTSSNVEFKVRFNQIIKFHEAEFQRSYLELTKNDINQVRTVMNDNIEQVLERNERINLLVNKTDRINNMSNTFRTSAIKVKRKMWWQNIKFWAVLIFVALVLLFVLFEILH